MHSTTNYGNIILFIPFSIRENNFDLYQRASRWQINARKRGDDKMPKIVAYRRDDENLEEYADLPDVLFKFDAKLIVPGTVIYILGDGLGDSHYISNIDADNPQEEAFVLPIELIAIRARAIGFDPDLACHCKAVKLFICEEHENANESLAKNFATTLGEDYGDLKIFYYHGKISIPIPTHDLTRYHKSSLKNLPPYETKKRTLDFITDTYRGPASKNRSLLLVSKTLEKEKPCFSQEIEDIITNNRAIPFKIEKFEKGKSHSTSAAFSPATCPRIIEELNPSEIGSPVKRRMQRTYDEQNENSFAKKKI